MQTIQKQLEQAFRAAIRAAFDIDADPLIGIAQNEKFGDYQSNAAMGLAKQVAEKTGQKTNPRAVAEQVKAKLQLGEMAREISIAGPGFINVRLSPEWLAGQLQQIAGDERLGLDKVGRPETVVVDYSGPNIAKQMHVGHLRSTIIGDAIARVLQFQGHHVIRQNHIGDWGTQFGMVILGVWHLIMARHRGEPDYVVRMGKALAGATDEERKKLIEQIHRRHQEDLDADQEGTDVFAREVEKFRPNLEELEPAYKFVNAVEDAPESKSVFIIRRSPQGERKVPLSAVSNDVIAMLQKGGGQNNQEEQVWHKVRQATLDEAGSMYERLNVQLTANDVRGESEYRSDLAETVSDLQRAAHARASIPSDFPRIRVEESAGAMVVFHTAPDGRPMFLNADGEPLPFLIRKSDGAYLYATTDLAALRHRVRTLHADEISYVTGAPQSLHFQMLFATARGAGWTLRPDRREVRLDHVSFGSILGEDGRPFKTRTGENVKLADLLDEAQERGFQVASTQNPELPERQRRDVGRAVGIGSVKYADLSKDRVSDYVFSWETMLSLKGNSAPYLQYAYARIESIFRKGGVQAPQIGTLLLESPYELALARHVVRVGEILVLVARELKPHYLCTYLYELATRFSGFYEACPVLKSGEPTRSSRLLLCALTSRALALGLDLLGIEHPDEM